MGSNQLFYSFKTKTNKSILEEIVVIELSNQSRVYNYCVSICDANKDIGQDKEVKTFDISFNYRFGEAFPLKIKENYRNQEQIIFEHEFYDTRKSALEDANDAPLSID